MNGQDAVGGLAWPARATTQASILASDWKIFSAVGLIIALIVWGLIFFALLRWRRRDDAEPPQFRENRTIEIAWTVVPLVIVAILFVYTFRAEALVDATVQHPAVTVAVRAYRWGWSFAYAGGPTISGSSFDSAIGEPASRPPELVLPLGETTRVKLSSDDVTHSFWVPDFLFKRDAIPGQENGFDLRPDKLGIYVGHCAQFCGYDHALMEFSVRVVTPQAFSAWRIRRSAP